MGTWNNKIDGSDTFQDIYQNFYDRYNEGQTPISISKQIQEEFAEMFADYDDRFDSLFGLALAQWETKSLDTKIYEQVKEIIQSGAELERWKGEIVDVKSIEQRQKNLDKFLEQISIEREKPKRRIKPKFEYNAVHLLTLPAPDGKKTFEIIESYVNGKYQDTSSGITWSTGGGSTFYFYEQGKFVTAVWVDSNNLEIRHDKTINFTKKEETFFYCGDQGIIRYIPE